MALCFFPLGDAVASPESPTPTPAAKAKQAGESAKKTSAWKARLAQTAGTSRGEPIYPSHPVTANRANPRTRRGVKVWKGWLVGTNGNPVRGQYARLPDGTLVDISVAVQKITTQSKKFAAARTKSQPSKSISGEEWTGLQALHFAILLKTALATATRP